MSKNYKNVHRPEYFKNFTEKIKHREILVESGSVLNGDIQRIVNRINSQTNQIIQGLNLKIADRQVPYITLDIKFRPEIGSKSRLVLIERDTDEEFTNSIERATSSIGQDVSHFIEILATHGYNEIVISPLGCDAEIVIQKEYIECAIIDLLLDIVMFNSYSFLKNMTTSKKHDFCTIKFDYFKKCQYSCFYSYKNDNGKSLYYSFAFSARKGKNSFDVDKYIELWNKFVAFQYHGLVHQEKSIADQLKQHVDYYELPKNMTSRFSKKPTGAYLVLRPNKDVTEDLHPFMRSVFGNNYNKANIRIIPIEKFKDYEFLCVNLDVSVFKIVKQ